MFVIVVRKRAASARSAGQPAYCITRTAQLKLAWFRVAWWGRVGPVHAKAPVDSVCGFWTRKLLFERERQRVI